MKMKKTVKGLMIGTLAVGTVLGGLLISKNFSSASDTPTIQVPVKQNHENHEQLLKQTLDLAKEGKVITSEEFGRYSSKKSIIAKWGEPDKDSKNGILKYSKHATQFYIGDSNNYKKSVYLLETTDKSYASVTYDEVKRSKALGKGGEYKDRNTAYIIYAVGENDLRFIFSVDKKGKISNLKYVEVNGPF
ncbi:DUF4309 domain-containing protein [Shimazuella kribbensis]|uniref:DUF4309 domain-containing protein n=1 Tax=Shimazuella kribbensis TaxID=139808 RepID=UPI00041BE0C8|nr:DUF4309 domain-containing protein [Shimazuella kribbensis]